MTLHPSPGTDHARPLIVTLATDAATQDSLNALRKAHFPKERSYLDAHVTLFHALPGDDEHAVRESLTSLCAHWQPFPLEWGAPSRHGRVVLVNLVAGLGPLAACHTALRRRWLPRLSNQDKQGFKAHVTILNKTDEEHARRVFDELTKRLPHARQGEAVGLDLWRYMGGPWEHLERFKFEGYQVKPQLAVDTTSTDEFPALGR